MKRIELERLIQERADEIAKSQIIPKCRDIAEQLGKGGRTSQEWANANFEFFKGPLCIYYQTNAMGDQQLRVTFGNEKVFEAVERVNTPPKYPNPAIVIDGRKFEILLYRPGEWEQKVQAIYYKMTTDITEEELVDAQRRFGI